MALPSFRTCGTSRRTWHSPACRSSFCKLTVFRHGKNMTPIYFFHLSSYCYRPSEFLLLSLDPSCSVACFSRGRFFPPLTWKSSYGLDHEEQSTCLRLPTLNSLSGVCCTVVQSPLFLFFRFGAANWIISSIAVRFLYLLEKLLKSQLCTLEMYLIQQTGQNGRDIWSYNRGKKMKGTFITA